VDGALYTYRLASNPVNIAGTTGVTVTRIESNTWVLDAGVAALSKARTVKGKQAVTQLGNFHMPMRVTVTNP
jgi:spore coat protein U-like protein